MSMPSSKGRSAVAERCRRSALASLPLPPCALSSAAGAQGISTATRLTSTSARSRSGPGTPSKSPCAARRPARRRGGERGNAEKKVSFADGCRSDDARRFFSPSPPPPAGRAAGVPVARALRELLHRRARLLRRWCVPGATGGARHPTAFSAAPSSAAHPPPLLP